MKYKTYVIMGLAVFLMYACGKEYLERDALGQLYETTIDDKKGVERLLIGAYSLLDGIGGNKSSWNSAASNWIYGSICGTEAYTGSDNNDGARRDVVPYETFESQSTSFVIASKWGTVYDGVARANDVLRIMAKATDIEPNDQKRIAAEARFLRAFYHFEAKKMWNRIPFVDETITYGNGNYNVANDTTWEPIENDLEFAIENLLEGPYQGSPGRATKYVAMALLVKAYLFQEKFADARPLLEKIINSNKFHLLDKYGDNFDPGKNNKSESVFSVQMSVNDGATEATSGGFNNGNFGDVLNFPFNGGPAGCCGFFCPSQYLVNHFKTDSATGLPDLDNFNDNPVKSDNGILWSMPFTPYAGFLDPRLDWTVGRRGIPYLDWGLHPGSSWIRDTLLDGPYSPKKNVYYQNQQSQLTDQAFWSSGTTTNTVKLIRYADVLLWAAEVEIETGNLNEGRDYINQVRRRAANPEGWIRNPDGTAAARYKVGEYTDNWTDREYARKALRYERMLELAMEGHRFFDLVRWHIADIEINKYLEKEKTLRNYLNGVTFEKGCDEYFPIPQVQLDLSAGADGIRKMTQNPCY